MHQADSAGSPWRIKLKFGAGISLKGRSLPCIYVRLWVPSLALQTNHVIWSNGGLFFYFNHLRDPFPWRMLSFPKEQKHFPRQLDSPICCNDYSSAHGTLCSWELQRELVHWPSPHLAHWDSGSAGQKLGLLWTLPGPPTSPTFLVWEGQRFFSSWLVSMLFLAARNTKPEEEAWLESCSAAVQWAPGSWRWESWPVLCLQAEWSWPL